MADEKAGSASGNRTRISALKGPRANRCTIAPERIAEHVFIAPPLIDLLLGMGEEFTRGVQTGSSGVRNGAATLRFPAHTLPQRRDVGHVMPAVPGIEPQGLIQSHRASLGMAELARELCGS
jgi:hypothetical protein